GALPRSNLAAFDASGVPTAWNPGADTSVRSLLLSGGVLYAGGEFGQLGDPAQPRAHLGAIDAASGAVLPWQPDPDGWVLALASAGDTIYTGGAFGTIAGQPRSHVAALGAVGAADAGQARSWQADTDDVVRAIAASCQTVYLGGSFTHVGGAARDHLA